MVQEVTRLETCPISSLKIENKELDKLLNYYNIYKQQTLNGEFGKTAVLFNLRQSCQLLFNFVKKYPFRRF